jgi:plastocyanin
MKQQYLRFAGSLAALAVLAACGDSPSSPSGGVTVVVPDGGATGTSGATITITAAGVSPASVTIARGQTVTFVNNDNRPHEMASNPHPQHGSCPSIEGGLGSLAVGQTKTTRAFGGSGSCGFHDHLNDTTNSLKGTITVQ